MTNIKLKYIKRFMDRVGRMRYYFNRPGYPKTALPGLPGSSEFMAAYAEAAGEAPKISAGAGRTKPGTIGALISEYYGSAEFKALKEITRINYRRLLELFANTPVPGARMTCADVKVRDFRPVHIKRIMDGYADRPGLARNLRLRLLKVFSFAVEREYCDSNPVRDVKAPRPKSKEGFKPWTQAEIERYLDYHQNNPRARMAMILLRSSAVRRSDAHRLGRQHITETEHGNALQFRAVKGDKPTIIPIDDELQREIDLLPAGQMLFVLTEYGKPFSAAGFSHKFKAWAVEAGINDKSAHGVRKAAAREAAEAGSSAHEVAALHGHNNLREVETYTQSVNQLRLASAAQEKRKKAKAGTKTFKPNS
ncbi:tyrosine recombinase XerC [Asticcacaulis sp.]|uniref:site-specific integrase n=1 Tax=Asticcacaulis sp. TaxID=1872648 RepID=UPI003919DA0F